MTNFDEKLQFRGDIWNLPITGTDDRWDVLNYIIGSHCGSLSDKPERSIRFLEIGVWESGTVHRLTKQFGNVFEYVGIDPYGKLVDDPYKGLFWKSDAEAEEVYQRAKGTFEEAGATLLRVSSDDYFKDDVGLFDIVFVDGDHRYAGALRDCENAWAHLKCGGLLMVDDYGNNFHPEVEWAVRKFFSAHSAELGQRGALPVFFELPGMVAPVMLMFIYFRKGE